jgi:GTP-binding protein
MLKSRLPKVVIVGRTNVGKSTLFNRLSVNTKSITLDQEGVTRDFLRDIVSWQHRTFELIDTGGISVQRSKDPITEQVRQRALVLLEQAQVILLVCDGSVGLVREDRELAALVRTFGKKIFLVLNKLDKKSVEDHLVEFDYLGYQDVFLVSAQHGKGIGELLEALATALPENGTDELESEERECKVVLLGKPNVGKSSLMNLLVSEERSIVHNEPGTTREPITERVQFYKQDIAVTDTAGIRRKRAVSEDLETLMVKSSFGAVQDADIVLLLVDSADGQMSDQELKLSFYVFEHNKGLIVLFNKQDLTTEQTQISLDDSLSMYKHFFTKIPQLAISCKTEKNIGKILPLVRTVWERYNQKFEATKLTDLCIQALNRRPLYHNKNLLYVSKVRQIRSAPITLLMLVNEPDWFGPSQLSFFENNIRDAYDLVGVPLAFVVRKRG